MGGGGGSTSTSTSVSGSAQKWAAPYAKQGAGAVQNVFNRNQPNLDMLTGKANQMVDAGMSKYNLGLGNLGASRGYIGDQIGGAGFNNPHLEGMIQAARGGVMDGVNGNFALAGRYGSGAHTGVLADSLGDMEAGLRFNNYNAAADRQMQAAGMAEGATQADAAQSLAPVALAGQLPYTGSESMASSLGSLFNGGTQKSSTTQKTDMFSTLLGGAAQVGAAYFSDERLKDNVTLSHVEPDGLPVYHWSYTGQDERHTGPMAQDVARVRPWALGPTVDGFMTIRPEAL